MVAIKAWLAANWRTVLTEEAINAVSNETEMVGHKEEIGTLVPGGGKMGQE